MGNLVAIVGRPNVGKSTLFNRLTKTRRAIVNEEAGTTRDRQYGKSEWLGREFSVVDTGGWVVNSDDIFEEEIRKQVLLAVDEADVILFVVDVMNGLTDLDMQVASILRRTKRPVIVVANKTDNNELQYNAPEFYKLGLGDPYCISAVTGSGTGDLLDLLVSKFKKESAEILDDDIPRFAVVGRPNAGKSSIVNAFIGEDRNIVTEIAGTTRDAIDTPFTYNGKNYIVIDTAGMRRKRAIEDESVEQYSVIRSLNAVRRADVCLIVMDANEGLSEQDVKIAGFIHDEGKPSVVVINKWDLVEKDTYTVEKFKKQLSTDLAFMDYFKYITLSALTGQRVGKLMEMVDYVYEKSNFRATTGLLNDVVTDAVRAVEPPSSKGRRAKIKYVTQPTTQPPTFVFFVSDAKLLHFSYRRYLENCIRRSFQLDGTPVKLVFRDDSDKE